MKDKQDETKREESPQANKSPVSFPIEVRIIGTFVLACVGAVLGALTFRLVRWIAGF